MRWQCHAMNQKSIFYPTRPTERDKSSREESWETKTAKSGVYRVGLSEILILMLSSFA